MTQQEIQQRNEQIAKMLGYYKEDFIWKVLRPFNGGHISTEIGKQLEFHSDYNWSMEVVDFIKNLKEIRGNGANRCWMITKFDITNNSVTINYDNGDLYNSIYVGHTDNGKYYKADKDVDTLKEALFIAISDFAKLYNNKEL